MGILCARIAATVSNQYALSVAPASQEPLNFTFSCVTVIMWVSLFTISSDHFFFVLQQFKHAFLTSWVQIICLFLIFLTKVFPIEQKYCLNVFAMSVCINFFILVNIFFILFCAFPSVAYNCSNVGGVFGLLSPYSKKFGKWSEMSESRLPDTLSVEIFAFKLNNILSVSFIFPSVNLVGNVCVGGGGQRESACNFGSSIV